MNYEWEDFGTYLGNEPDYSNDFQRTKMIRFDIGSELKFQTTREKRFILWYKIGQMFREYSKFSNLRYP